MRLTTVVAVLAVILTPALANGQTTSAIKTGERTTGSTKQCYYQAAGREYTETVASYQVCPATLQVRSPIPPPPPTPAPSSPSGGTAFKTGERQTGSTKECSYEFAGKSYAKTVESYQLCPLSIRVP